MGSKRHFDDVIDTVGSQGSHARRQFLIRANIEAVGTVWPLTALLEESLVSVLKRHTLGSVIYNFSPHCPALVLES